ncbi:MAG: DUF5000 domain-containing lipoprotein [Kiritimatiellae bacterium]|nr:DUF5000 domain-containing lipoprotein [Kiritimatiellia bacterium]
MNRKEQMTRVTGRVTTLVVAAFLTFGFGYAAEMITPVAVTAQSSYYVYPKLAAIDGSGLVPYSPVTATSLHGIKPTGEMWLSNGTLDTWITFDLGAVQSLTGFHLWNYNEAGDFSRRGVKTAGIYVGNSMPADGTPYASAGPAWGTLVENMTFTKASGAAGDAGADYAFANTVTGRYIQVYVTSSYGKDAYTGISEIRFYALTARSVDDQFVSPVTATAEQSWSGRRVPTATLNGSGMTPNAPVRVNSTAGNATEVGSMSNMWLNSVTNKTWITFDLGTIQKVTGFRVWNYNEHSGNPGLYTKSGVNRASLYVGNTLPPNGMAYASAGAAWGRWVQDFKFAKADGTPALTGADYALAMPLVGRYIQLYITDSFGNNSAGLSEIGFYTSTRYAAISPIAATAQSWYAAANDTRSPTKAVNGSGMIPNNPLTPASLAGTLASDMWLSLGTTNTWITFDLGAEQSIAGIHLWNYNEYSKLSSSYSERGVKGAGLYVGDTLLADNTPYVNAGANWGTLVTNMTFAKADGLATEAGDHYTLAGAVTSRYVQIYVTSNYLKDNYTGISEIMFYTPMRDLTRLSSGDKVIENRATESVRVVEGTGTIGALTLGAAATSVNSLYVAATTEPVTVDLAGQTLALTKIEMQGDAGGLAIGSTSASGTLKSARTYLTVDNQSANPVTINAAIADGSGASSLTKSGRGVLILSEANTYSGNTTVNGGTLQLMGGSINTPAIDLNGGTLQLAAGSSATAVQLALNVGTGGLLNFDGGTLAVGSGAPVLDWIGAGNSISIADGGAVIDTANGSVAINRPLLAAGTSTGGLTKTGANTLTLTAPASYTGVTVVQGGTLKLVAPAPIIHYDFDTASISGTTLLNRGTGGAAYNGVIMGAPVTGGLERAVRPLCSVPRDRGLPQRTTSTLETTSPMPRG